MTDLSYQSHTVDYSLLTGYPSYSFSYVLINHTNVNPERLKKNF